MMKRVTKLLFRDKKYLLLRQITAMSSNERTDVCEGERLGRVLPTGCNVMVLQHCVYLFIQTQ